MTLGKSIKNLFVAEDPTDEKVAPVENASEATPARSGRSGSSRDAQTDTDESPSGGDVDAGMLANLEKALDDNTPKTPYGYLQFRDSLAKMKKKIPSEATRFQAALAAAEGMDCDAARIVSTAQAAIAVLKGEQTQFKQEIDALNKIDDSKQADLKDTEDQIAALELKKTKINKELASSATKIQTKQGSFQITFKSLVAEINADIASVQECSSK